MQSLAISSKAGEVEQPSGWHLAGSTTNRQSVHGWYGVRHAECAVCRHMQSTKGHIRPDGLRSHGSVITWITFSSVIHTV